MNSNELIRIAYFFGDYNPSPSLFDGRIYINGTEITIFCESNDKKQGKVFNVEKHQEILIELINQKFNQ